MKIISEKSSVSDNPCSNRVPSKEDSFWKHHFQVNSSVAQIPADDSCPTEDTNNPCKASKYVKCIKKMHKKLACKTVHCKVCNKVRKMKEIDRRRILNKTKAPCFLMSRSCISNSDNGCPRVKQIKDWLIYCKFKKYNISKCKKHACLLKKIKLDAELKFSVISEIMKN